MKNEILDMMEIEENITSVVFESFGRMPDQVTDEIKNILNQDKQKTMVDCEVEYDNTNDQYKQSLDIPTAQAMIDMGCSDPGYLELKTWAVRQDRSRCCKDDAGNSITNNHAGRLDQACFTELCVPVRGRLYRLEMKTGAEVAKHKDIFYLQSQLKCTLQESERFKEAFKLLDLDKNTVFKIIFGKHSKDKGIQGTGNVHLEYYEILAEEMREFKLINDNASMYQEDEFGNDIDDIWQNNLDPEVIEMSFKDDLPVDSNIFTFKRLSIPEESLSEEEIEEIKYSDYNQYKAVTARYMEPKWIFTGKDHSGKNKFASVGKKITDEKTSTSISMAWIYLNEAKEKFNNNKDTLVKETLKIGVSDEVYDAIQNYKQLKNTNKAKQAKYRLTTCIYGGEWNEQVIPKATPGEAEICWRVINNKM